MSANDNQMSDKDFKEIKEKESDELVLNCRKPEGELGEKMIQRMNKSHENLAQWGVSHLNVCEDDDILDIGCGGGVNVKRFAGMTNGKVYGIDYSKTSVKESEKYNKEEIEKGQVKILQGSVSELPFDDESFDIVSGFETIYFWPDLLNDFKEIHRVLKKDGAIFICNEERKDEGLEERMGNRIELLDMTILSEDELGEMLAEAGFKDVTTFTNTKTTYLCAIGRKE
ncbi:class I SAM-dependent methyltransferase [Methanobrevibacter boviskoreani]|uniref:class I SAM-dependent methyltransferase n=1 Tax=Methanobrevibacter boviskoreani TaxID=1348249 RepID=UPI000A4AAFA0|nr:class I SAM-dependent methyltransferase [Methanobrevibacter boviskoreani]